MIPNISTQQEDILKPGDQTKSIRQDQLDINLNEIPSVNSSINEYEPPPISGIEGIYTDPSKKVLESSNDHGHSEVAFSKSSTENMLIIETSEDILIQNIEEETETNKNTKDIDDKRIEHGEGTKLEMSEDILEPKVQEKAEIVQEKKEAGITKVETNGMIKETSEEKKDEIKLNTSKDRNENTENHTNEIVVNSIISLNNSTISVQRRSSIHDTNSRSSTIPRPFHLARPSKSNSYSNSGLPIHPNAKIHTILKQTTPLESGNMSRNESSTSPIDSNPKNETPTSPIDSNPKNETPTSPIDST